MPTSSWHSHCTASRCSRSKRTSPLSRDRTARRARGGSPPTPGSSVGPRFRAWGTADTTQFVPPATLYFIDVNAVFAGHPFARAFHTSGTPAKRILPPIAGTIDVTSQDRFKVTSTTLLKGNYLIRNTSDTIHFVDFAPVKNSTTDATITRRRSSSRCSHHRSSSPGSTTSSATSRVIPPVCRTSSWGCTRSSPSGSGCPTNSTSAGAPVRGGGAGYALSSMYCSGSLSFPDRPRARSCSSWKASHCSPSDSSASWSACSLRSGRTSRSSSSRWCSLAS